MKSKLGKYLLIYFGCVAGLAVVIGGSFLLGKLANRLKVEKQQLIEVNEEAAPESEHILKIYVWETVPDKEAMKNIEKTIDYYNENHLETAYDGLRYDVFSSSEYETYRLTELKTDESIKVSEPLLLQSSIVYCEKSGSFEPAFVNHQRIDHSAFIARFDGYIDSIFTIGTAEYCGKEIPVASSPTVLDWTAPNMMHGRDSLMLWPRVNRSDSDIKDCLQSDRNGEPLHYLSYTERLADIHPTVGGTDAYVTRDVCESALIFYALDDANPNKILAEAEVRITYRSPWKFTDSDGLLTPYDSRTEYTLKLNSLGINNPDDYGYTEAVLFSYWQSDAVS